MNIKQVIKGRRENKENLKHLLENLYTISAKSKTIVICLDSTDRSYLGCVKVTHRLFPNNTLLIPSYYSNVLLSSDQKLKFCNELINLNLDQIIISGHPESLNFIVDYCYNKIKLKTVFYGALSELIVKQNDVQFSKIMEYLKDGKLVSIGYNKAGLAEWMNNLFGFNTYFIQLFSNIKAIKPNNNPIKKIGVLGAPNFNKNVVNAIAASLSIEDTEIHTFSKVGFLKGSFENRIISYDILTDQEFEDLRNDMDLNIHISFSEGSGGQIFIDSLASGIPCITSLNNDYLVGNEYLSDLLVIDQYDNPEIIKNSILNVLNEDKLRLRNEVLDHVSFKNKEGNRLLDAFINSH